MAIAQNSQAHFNYEVLETFEVGIVLKGCEVKAIREGRISLQQAWVQVSDQELWLRGLTIPTYAQASFDLPDPARVRKLLAHRREIRQMAQACDREGMTIVPLKLYFVKSHLKVLVGLCRGKSHVDKRHDAKERDDKRQMQRALKGRLASRE